MADSANGSNEPQVTFTIKNPSKHEADAFKLTVPLSATLADIQRRITAEYDGNPPPQSQTVSAGRCCVAWWARKWLDTSETVYCICFLICS